MSVAASWKILVEELSLHAGESLGYRSSEGSDDSEMFVCEWGVSKHSPEIGQIVDSSSGFSLNSASAIAFWLRQFFFL